MKNISLLAVLLLTFTFLSCDKEEVIIEEPMEAGSILGRWVLEGFEQTIRYEFTEDKRFTIYGEGDGNFPTLEEFQAENPQLTGHDWYYDGDVVVVDLNFGNYSRLLPNFACDNKVINWTMEDEQAHSTFFREGHDISACN